MSVRLGRGVAAGAMLWALASVAGCGDSGDPQPDAAREAGTYDAGDRDGGSDGDGGAEDAAISFDATVVVDAALDGALLDGAVLDGGALIDGGVLDGAALDSGALLDSGAVLDGGALIDSGALVGDSGALVGDSGALVSDSGALVGDSGTRDSGATDGGFVSSDASADGTLDGGASPTYPAAGLALTDAYDPDLDIDGSDVLHVGFRRDGAIHHARWESGTWITERVIRAPSGSDPLGEYEMAVDPRTDELALVYADIYGVYFRRRDSTGWGLPERIQSSRITEAVLGLSFTFDAEGVPHVFYRSGSEVRYATRGSTGWTYERTGSPDATVSRSSIAVDSTGTVHVAYYARLLYYSERDASGWSHEVVDDGAGRGAFPSLALDSAARPHIGYHDSGATDLRYAHWTGATWDRVIAATDIGTVGRWTAIVLDDADRPIIAHEGGNAVQVTSWTGSTWAQRVLDRAPTSPSSSLRDFGGFIQMARDAAGQTHLVYQHAYLPSIGPRVYELYYSRL